MARPEINRGKAVWNLPPARTKNGLPHDVPLSDAALAIIDAIPERAGRDLLFGDRDGPFQGWSKAKAALDARVIAAREEKAGKGKGKLAPWRLHDIRRTVATRMAELGVLPHAVEAVLNHISGHKAGVAGIYNRAIYSAEKRQALDRWAEHVTALVEGRASNVVALRANEGR